jgi:molybdate transport system substrate-binding protein
MGRFIKKALLAIAVSTLGLGCFVSPLANVHAAEVQILAGGAMTAPLRELAAQFEKASGDKLVFRFGATP